MALYWLGSTRSKSADISRWQEEIFRTGRHELGLCMVLMSSKHYEMPALERSKIEMRGAFKVESGSSVRVDAGPYTRTILAKQLIIAYQGIVRTDLGQYREPSRQEARGL